MRIMPLSDTDLSLEEMTERVSGSRQASAGDIPTSPFQSADAGSWLSATNIAFARGSPGNFSDLGVPLTHSDSSLVYQDRFSPEAFGDGVDVDYAYYLNNSYSDAAYFYEQLIDHSAFKMRDFLFRYASPVFLVLGNISNLLALFVLQRKKLRRSSVCFYLSAYAVANLCVLDFMLAVAWFCSVFQKPYVTMLADWTCRLWMFLSNVMTFSGIWFVVVMNIDRLIYLTSKTKAKSYCTAFAAKTIVIFVIIGLVVVSIHAMWTYALQPQGCFVSYQQQDLHTIIWPWWSAAVYSYIPSLLLLILTIAQAVTICVRWVPQCVPCPECARCESSPCTMYSDRAPCRSCAPSSGCTKMSWCGCFMLRRPNSTEATTGPTPDDFILTVMVVSLSFFLLTIPATVINVLDIHLPSSALTVDIIARIELTKKITELLSWLNRTVLGYLLLICSKDFRQEFLASLRMLFCCFRSRRIFKVFEMRFMSNSEDSSPQVPVDYELCNNNDETITDV